MGALQSQQSNRRTPTARPACAAVRGPGATDVCPPRPESFATARCPGTSPALGARCSHSKATEEPQQRMNAHRPAGLPDPRRSGVEHPGRSAPPFEDTRQRSEHCGILPPQRLPMVVSADRGERPLDPFHEVVGLIQFRPDPSDDPTPVVAQSIFTALFLEHDVTGCFTWSKQPAILDPAVEFPQQTTAVPGVIAPAEKQASVVVYVHLQSWCRKAGHMHQHPASGLTHALAESVGEPSNTAGRTAAWRPADPLDRIGQLMHGQQTPVQSAIRGDDGLLKRKDPRQVSDCPAGRCDLHPVDDHDLVVNDGRSVRQERPRTAAVCRSRTRHMHDAEVR